MLADERDRLQQLLLGADRRVGRRTGFRSLDELLGDGLQPGHLILLGSRPGYGKSALALQMAATSGLHDRRRVAVFSSEATELELVQRLWAFSARVASSRLRTASLREEEWAQAHKGYEALRSSPIRIDDTPGMDVEQVCADTRRLARNQPIGLVVVDSLQGLVQEGGPGSCMAPISRLNHLARDLETPVVATVRLPGRTAGATQRGEALLLDDLRRLDAEPVEQEADVLMLLDLGPDLSPDSGRPGEAGLYVSKNRGGPTGAVPLCFLDQRGTFAELARDDDAPATRARVPHSRAWRSRR